MLTDRIKDSFDALAARGDMGLIPYLTVGFPNVEETVSLVHALEEGGADVVELGVPFSDPIADGPTIQRSSFHALTHFKPGRLLKEALHQTREGNLAVPIEEFDDDEDDEI